MLLTCPTCRSGLEVPDGTTAHVRCPSCRAIFPAVGNAAPPPAPAGPPPRLPFGQAARPAPAPKPVPAAKPAPPRWGWRPPAAKPAPAARPAPPLRPVLVTDEPDEAPPPTPPRKRRRYDDPDGPSAEERAAIQAAFGRGMWGCRLLSLAFALQGAALLLVVVFLARNAVMGPAAGLLVGAGVLAGVGWLAGAVGVGLGLAGPPSPGHLGFGVGAAVAVGVHGVLLLALVSQRPERTGLMGQVALEQADVYGQVPTKFDAVTLYLVTALYPEEERFVIRKAAGLAIAVGVAELVRLIFVTMLLSCLARAAGDEDVVHRCVRAGGVGSLGPGTLAVLMLLLFAVLAESGGLETNFGAILVSVAVMGVYALLAGMLVPAMVAARDAADACEYPFQDRVIDLGG